MKVCIHQLKCEGPCTLALWPDVPHRSLGAGTRNISVLGVLWAVVLRRNAQTQRAYTCFYRS